MIIDPSYEQKSAAKPNNLLWHCSVKKMKAAATLLSQYLRLSGI